MAATMTRKTKTAEPVTIQAGIYTCTVIKNQSITIRCTKKESLKVGRRVIFQHRFLLSNAAADVQGWLKTLTDSANAELAALIDDLSRADGLVADWILDHAGWAGIAGMIEVRDHYEMQEVEHENTLHVGDSAAHGSFNLVYFGRIKSITDKTVTVSDHEDLDCGTDHRMKLERFCTYNFSAENTARQRRNNDNWTD